MTVDSFLAQYSGKKVFFRSFAGNGGDALLFIAAHNLFVKHGVNYQMADENISLDNQIVFVRGGGNLVKYYEHTAEFIKKRCANVKELIILPHTISGHEDILTHFDERVTVFCREKASYDYVKSYPNIQHVYIDDDMAFGINVKDVFPSILPVRRLVYSMRLRRLLSEFVKGKLPLSVYLQKRDDKTLYAFRTDVERTGGELPQKNIDISELINYDPNMGNVKMAFKTSKQIFRIVNQYKTIHTNRLHISIASILMGKKVFFYGNAYHKNRSVFEFSINQKFNNVTWID